MMSCNMYIHATQSFPHTFLFKHRVRCCQRAFHLVPVCPHSFSRCCFDSSSSGQKFSSKPPFLRLCWAPGQVWVGSGPARFSLSESEVAKEEAMAPLQDLGPDGSLEAKAEQLVGELRDYVKTGVCRRREWRVEQLKGVLRLIKEREPDIVDALKSDIGKPELETFVSEIQVVAESCKLAIKQLDKWMAPQKVSGTLATFPSTCTIVPEPLGVVLVISAWNYPLVLALDPVVGAISAGNAVVVKPSEVAPATSSLIAKLLPKYVDSKAVRVVEGGIPETAALLEQHWDIILYTGSAQIGRIVMAAAAKHLTPVILELGGKSPTIVDSTVDLKASAKRIASGKWGSNNGQACVAPDYILAEESIVPQLVDSLRSTIKSFYGEDPKLSGDLSKIVNHKHFGRLKKLLDDRVSDKIVFGGDSDEKSLYIAPTVVVDPPLDSPLMTEEIFGPILPIIPVKSIDEAVKIVNSRPKPLALYLFTNNKKVEQQVVEETSAGGMVVNDTVLHFVVPGLPFGGVGESGMGAYHGRHSFDSFSHKKALLSRGLKGDVSARYPPYDKAKKNFLRTLLEGDFVGLLLTILGLKK